MTAGEDLARALFIAFVVVVASWIRAERASCPPGWYVEGVRPTGETRCLRAEPDDPNDWPGDDPRDRSRLVEQPSHLEEIPIRIYCTGGTMPIVINERTIGCQHRH